MDNRVNIWGFDIGKGSLGEAVRIGSEIKHVQSLILYKDFGEIKTAAEIRRQYRTRKVFKALEDICMAFDLGVPIWLDSTVEDFRLHSKCRFTRDNFIESIEFDYLELQVIEED